MRRPSRVFAMPALMPQLLADDDGRRTLGLVFFSKRAAQQQRYTERLEVVLADDILPRAMDHPRIAASSTWLENVTLPLPHAPSGRSR